MSDNNDMLKRVTMRNKYGAIMLVQNSTSFNQQFCYQYTKRHEFNVTSDLLGVQGQISEI